MSQFLAKVEAIRKALGRRPLANQFFSIGLWWAGDLVCGTSRGQRNTVDGERVKVNFFIFYEIDQQTVKKVLRLDDYDSEWVLLASLDQG